MNEKVKCLICGREFKYLGRHLYTHKTTIKQYLINFPDAKVGLNPMQKEENKAKFRGENNPMKREDVKEKHLKSVRTEEYRDKLSEIYIKRWADNEYKEKMSEIYKESWKNDEDRRERMSEIHQGMHHTEEAKQKISAHNAMKRSEVIAKVSGEKHHAKNPEYRKKQSKRMKGQESVMCGKTGKDNAMSNPKIRKKHKEAMQLLTGENNPNWKGGTSYLPYCEKFDDDFKERVRNFFGRYCYVCGKNEIDNGEKLSVHHVTYNKDTCCDNTKPLFVPLCKSCHAKTLFDREYWEEFFTVSLNYLTDGECFTKK